MTHQFRTLFIGAAALLLAACGGGGGRDVASIPPPPPPPPAPPPPLPPPPSGMEPVQIFPGVTSSTDFAVVGLELTGDPAAPLRSDGFTVRYDEASNLYIFDLPTHESGGFYASPNSSSTFWSGGLVTASQPGTAWPPMSVLKPSPTNPEIQLSYTSFAAYLQAGPMDDLPHGLVAFGAATPQGAVPVTGSATYEALVGGFTDQSAAITGSATLQFNFGAGQLSGHFDPIYVSLCCGLGEQIPLGRYDFVNTVYGVGSTTFSGQLSNSGFTQNGTFDGLFTGPNAQELMARWTAPYHDPIFNTDSRMFGVWVGKRP